MKFSLRQRRERLLVDDEWYLETYPEVRESGLTPFRHFMKIGVREGHNPNQYFDTNWYLNEYPDVARSGKNPLTHYLNHGADEERDPCDTFSTSDYLSTYQDVAAGKINPLLHYLLHGRYEGRLAVSKTGVAAYQRWIENNDTLGPDDIDLIKRHIASFRSAPLISVVVPVYNTKDAYLRALVDSLDGQLYENWELCLADDASPLPHVRPLLQQLMQSDQRIKCVFRKTNGNISAATNSALDIATGDFIALVDHDDVLPPQALYEVAAEIDAFPDVDIIYTDQDLINAEGVRLRPYFKTDWNLDLLLGQNMVNHLGVYRRSLIEQVGRLRLGYEGSQDYDLVLRASDATTPDRIRHIPAILYHWRMDADAGNFSRAQQEKCFLAAKRAIEDHLERSGEVARVVAATGNPAYTRVVRSVPTPKPLVSILIPTRDRADLVAQCLDGLLNRTDYEAIEIIIIDNDSVEKKTAELFEQLKRDPRITILRFPGSFNYSAMNNAAAEIARGEVLLLLNNDVDVIHADWLTELVSHALRKNVGAVGAKLYYADNRLQHGGVVLGFGGSAGHYHPSARRQAGGYYSDLHLTRRVSAVTGACLAIRRSIYRSIGGLDAEHLPIAYNDIDLCIRLGEAGLHVIWTPFAELFHYESQSRGSDQAPGKLERFKREQAYLQSKWSRQLSNDPFYNPNLALNSGYPHLADVSRRQRPWLRHDPGTPDIVTELHS